MTQLPALLDRSGSAMAWKTFLHRPFLVAGLKPGNLDGVTRRQLAFIKRLLR